MDSPHIQKAFVAMFDVLGFTNLVIQTPLVELLQNYERLRQVKLWAADVPVVEAAGVVTDSVPTSIFSDTILLWAHDDAGAVDSFLAACSTLIADALKMRWPVRGGIAYGDCVLDRSRRVFVGKPIVHAYETEQSQDWIGAALHPSCLDHPGLRRLLQTDEPHDCVGRYEVPMKRVAKRAKKKPLTLQWAIRWSDRLHNPLDDLARTRGDRKLRKTVARKYDNTEKFIRRWAEGAMQ